MDYRYRNPRPLLIGGAIGLIGALLVAIVMIAYRVHPLLLVPALSLDIVLLIVIKRRWTIPILGSRTPYCLETKQPLDRAAYLVRAVLGIIIGVPLGWALAMRVARTDTAFMIVWVVAALGIAGAVTIYGDRVLMR